MQFTAHLGDQQRWQEQAHSYRGDLLCSGCIDEVELRGYNTVEDCQEDGEGSLESSKEGLEQVAAGGGNHRDWTVSVEKGIDKRMVSRALTRTES